LKDKDLIARCDVVDIWLRARCGGLIEAHRDPNTYQRYNSRLEYLHRTVHEFLSLPEIKSRILGATEKNAFSPSQALLQSTVLYIKWVMHPMDPNINRSFLHPYGFPSIFGCTRRGLVSAFHAEFETGKAQILMLEELDRVCNSLFQDFAVPPYYWANEELYYNPDLDDLTDDSPTNHCNCILSIAIQSGLYFYVARKIKSDPSLIKKKSGRPLLHYAVQEADVSQTSISCVSEEILELLLTHGASPNQTYEGVSAWEHVLTSIFKTLGKLDTQEEVLLMWTRIARMFLFHGANMVQCLGNDPNKSAYKIITAAFYDRFPKEANDLQKMLVPPHKFVEKHLYPGISSPRSSSSNSQEASPMNKVPHSNAPQPPPIFRIAPPSAQWSIQNASKRMQFHTTSTTSPTTPLGVQYDSLAPQVGIPAISEQCRNTHEVGMQLLPLQTEFSASTERPHTRKQQLSLSQIYNLISID
jgi:hypothetical protein